ncbi:hypothetical protein BC830DRAFT_275137 [Chytriomyces sp. MP71]|nr:hypothetical protein BC830DRAFT_275137 [Chytriomyces sp. MP71]
MDTLLDLNTCFNQHVAISPTNLARAIRCATMKRFLALWLVLFLASLHLAEGQNTPQGCKTDSDCGAGQVCKGGLYCMAGNNPSTTTSANTNGASNNAGGGGSGTEVINCTIQTLNQCGSDWATRFKQPLVSRYFPLSWRSSLCINDCYCCAQILGLVIGGGVLVLILVPTIVCCIVKGACCAARTAAKTSAGVVGGVAKGMAAGVSGAGGGGGGDGGHAHMEGRDRRLAPPSQAQINDHRERNYGGIGSGAYSPSNWNGARNDDKGALPNLHNSNPRRSDPRNYEAYDAPVRQRSLPRNNNTNGPGEL